MTVYSLLFYEVVDDYIERRGEYRADHLELANAAHARGELVFAGALDEPADGAVLVFATDDMSVPEEFARNDPYVKAGIVSSWKIRRWNVVVGDGAA